MNKKRLYLTMDELRAEYVDWSKDTIYRRVRKEGFPAIKDSGQLVFPRDKVIEWFKRREVKGA